MKKNFTFINISIRKGLRPKEHMTDPTHLADYENMSDADWDYFTNLPYPYSIFPLLSSTRPPSPPLPLPLSPSPFSLPLHSFSSPPLSLSPLSTPPRFHDTP